MTIAAPGVLGNDSDADGDALSAVLGTDATSGTLTLNTNGSFSYTPNERFNGSLTFTYRASDGQATSGLATVAITVTGLPIVEGTAGNDTLDFTGQAGPLEIRGLDGDDLITGSLGNDTIDGGLGNDIMDGSGGNDILFGRDGNDTLAGGAGNDILDGGPGWDKMFGGPGDDEYRFLFGNGGIDTINDASSASGSSGTGGGTDELWMLDTAGSEILFGRIGDDLHVTDTFDTADGFIDEGVSIEDFYLSDNNRIEFVYGGDGVGWDLSSLR